MKYKVIVNDEIDENKISIINYYWEYVDEGFRFDNNVISDKFKIEVWEVIQLIKEKSYCEIKLDRCLNCNEAKKYIVKTRANFEYIVNSFSRICDNCNKYKVLINESYKLSNRYCYNAEYAIKNKLWEELLPIEFEVLKGIIKHKRKDLIYRYVFNGNTYDVVIWNVINHLEFLGLITLIRDDSGRILKFDFSEKLEILIC